MTDEAVGNSMEGGGGEGRSPRINRNGTPIVNDGYGSTVRRWDASTGKSILEPTDGHSGLVKAPVMSDDGMLIFMGSRDYTVGQWDARNDEAIGKPLG